MYNHKNTNRLKVMPKELQHLIKVKHGETQQRSNILFKWITRDHE